MDHLATVFESLPFTLSEYQKQKLFAWVHEEHNKVCPLTETPGSQDGRFTLCFTPTGALICVEAKCACGHDDGKIDLTEYDKF